MPYTEYTVKKHKEKFLETKSYYSYEVAPTLYDRQCEIQEAGNDYRVQKLRDFEAKLIAGARECNTWYGKRMELSVVEQIAYKLKAELNTAQFQGVNDDVIGRSTNKLFNYLPLILQLDIETLAAIVFRSAFNCYFNPFADKYKTRYKKIGAHSYKNTVIAYRVSTLIEEELNFQILIEKQAKKKYVLADIKQLKNRCGTNRQYYRSECIKLYKKYDVEPITLERKEKICLGNFLIHAAFGSFPVISPKNWHLAKTIVDQHKQEQESNRQLFYWDRMPTNKYPVWVLKPTDWVVDIISKEKTALESVLMSREPMIIPPRMPILDNEVAAFSYGYLKTDRYGKPLRGNTLRLVKYQNSAYHKKYLANTSMTILLSAFEILQTTQHRIDCFILEFQQYCLNNFVILKDGILPNYIETEIPKDASPIKYMYLKEKNSQASRNLAGYTRLLNIAHKFKHEEALYLPHQLDKRSRMYCVTWPSTQGADYERTLFEFKESVLLDDDSIEYLKIWTANIFKSCFKTGKNLSNLSLEERKQWVDEVKAELILMGKEPLNYTGWQNADKPFIALRACREWFLIDRDKDKHRSHLRVDIDFSCSGLQIVALLLRCDELAKLVNLQPTNKPNDIYIKIAAKITIIFEKIIGSVKSDGSLKERALLYAKKEIAKQVKAGKRKQKQWTIIVNAMTPLLDDYYAVSKDAYVEEAKRLYWQYIACHEWLKIGISRSIVKRPTMTFTYSSKPFGMKRAILIDTLKPLLKENPDKYDAIFPCRDIACYSLAENIYNSMCDIAPTAVQFMDWVQESVSIVLENMEATETAKPIVFVAPTHFTVVTDYKIETQKNNKIKLPFVKRAFTVSYYEESNKINRSKTINAIAPNIVHMIDATIMMFIIDAAKKEGIMSSVIANHDCIGVHFPRLKLLHKVVRETLVLLFKPNQMKFYFKWVDDNGDYQYHKSSSITDMLYKQFKLQAGSLADKIKPPPFANTLNFDRIKDAIYCIN